MNKQTTLLFQTLANDNLGADVSYAGLLEPVKSAALSLANRHNVIYNAPKFAQQDLLAMLAVLLTQGKAVQVFNNRHEIHEFSRLLASVEVINYIVIIVDKIAS